MTGDRYHLTLASAGRPVMHGWWGREDTARSQFTTWVGSWSELPEALITLDDEETGRRLKAWPPPTPGAGQPS